MPFNDVQQMMDSTASAAYIEKELLHTLSETFMEITPGPDLRDKVPAIVNSEGADMDAISRDRVTTYGKPQWVSKGSNVKASVNEAKTRETYPIHELVLCAKFERKELRQAAKLNRPLQADRVKAVKTEMDIYMRGVLYDGVPDLDIPGFLSDVNKVLFRQAGSAITGMSDTDLEDFFIDILREYEEENGTDYPIRYIALAPELHARFLRSKGSDGGGPSMKTYLAQTHDIPVENWFSDFRLKSKTMSTAVNKPAMLFLPAYPRVVNIFQPVRFAAEEPYRDGSDLVLEFYQQFAGVRLNEKIPAVYED